MARNPFGFAPRGFSGLLDDPQRAMGMQLAAGLLAARGPTTMPQSLGGAVGQAIPGAMQAGQLAQQSNIRNQEYQAKVAARDRAAKARANLSGLLGDDPMEQSLFDVSPDAYVKGVYDQRSPQTATPAMKNAAALGFAPGTKEYSDYVQRVTNKPLVSLTNDRESAVSEAYGQKTGGFYGDEFARLQGAASSARTNSARLNRAKQLLAGVKTGATQPTQQFLKGLARDLGVDLAKYGFSDDVGMADALGALSVDFTLDAVARTKGAVSEREMTLFERTAVSLGNSPEGNMLLIEMAQELDKRSIVVAQKARKYEQDHGMLDAGFFDELDQHHTENPMFTESLLDRIDAASNVQSQIKGRKVINGKGYHQIGNQWFED